MRSTSSAAPAVFRFVAVVAVVVAAVAILVDSEGPRPPRLDLERIVFGFGVLMSVAAGGMLVHSVVRQRPVLTQAGWTLAVLAGLAISNQDGLLGAAMVAQCAAMQFFAGWRRAPGAAATATDEADGAD